MSTFRLTNINIEGFNEARRDPRILAELMRRGEAAAEAAGGGDDFLVIDSSTPQRARVVVVAATYAAQRAEAETRALTRGFDAARG